MSRGMTIYEMLWHMQAGQAQQAQQQEAQQYDRNVQERSFILRQQQQKQQQDQLEFDKAKHEQRQKDQFNSELEQKSAIQQFLEKGRNQRASDQNNMDAQKLGERAKLDASLGAMFQQRGAESEKRDQQSHEDRLLQIEASKVNAAAMRALQERKLGDQEGKNDFDKSLKLRKDFEKTPEFIAWNKTVKPAYEIMQKAGGDDSSGISDTDLIFNYGAIIHPNLATREANIQAIQSSADIPEKIKRMWEQATQPGGAKLSTEQRQIIIEEAGRAYKVRQQEFNGRRTYMQGVAKHQGVDPYYIDPDTSEGNPTTQTAPSDHDARAAELLKGLGF